MLSRLASLIAVFIFLLAGDRPAIAGGGLHIRYGPDAPEKLAAANVRYYEGVLNLEHNHPAAFAADHPFYTKMFNDPVMLDKLTARWEAHEQRFEYWHNCLWKVLDGYLLTHEHLPGNQVIGAESGGTSPPPGLNQHLNGNGGDGPPNSDGGSPGGGITTSSLPEPSSGLLSVLGLFFAGSWFAWRRG
jgi:hypothetical protein